MKANELRIGNLLQGYSGQLFEITIDDLMIIENGDSKAKPIPLTEEWLLKFGFVKHSSNPFWFKKDDLCVSLVGKVELISWDMQIFRIDAEIKSAHQLQNLYFALTGGKELELNEK